MADPLLIIALPTHRYLYGDQIHTRHVKLFPLLCYIRPSQFFTIYNKRLIYRSNRETIHKNEEQEAPLPQTDRRRTILVSRNLVN